MCRCRLQSQHLTSDRLTVMEVQFSDVLLELKIATHHTVKIVSKSPPSTF